MKKLRLVLIILVLLAGSCEHLPNPFQEDTPPAEPRNLPPDTHLFLAFPEESVDTLVTDGDTSYVFHGVADTTTSRQILYWWGEDPDGDVVAYQTRWNFEDTWDSTSSEMDTFYLPLKVAYDEFVFEVRAQDDQGALDPTPVSLRIPVANQAPEIEFALNSYPTVGADPDVEFLTFPTRTFSWTVSDLDGFETINRIRYALDDTSAWQTLPGNISSITLDDLTPGLHTFFVQAIDTAGAYSDLIHFPDSSDLTTPNGWRVIEPVGEVLLVDDYELDNGETAAFYTGILDTIYGPENYSVFEVGDNEKAMPTSLTDQQAMFNYFKSVIWYHYADAPRLPEVDGGLRAYLEDGGNLFVSSIRVDEQTKNYTFTSIDSNWVLNPTGRMFSNLEIYFVDPSIDDSVHVDSTLSLRTDVTIFRRVSGYYPRPLEFEESTRDLFILQEARDNNDRWTGNAPIAQLYQPSPGSGKSIFFSLPLHVCNGNGNMVGVMRTILEDIFQ